MPNFLVIGPESSGTRMLAQAFISSGCFGDAGHSQRLDRDISVGKTPKVLRSSLPHGRT